MSDLFVEINESNWDAEVVQSETPVLLDFWAPWCMPCKALEPTLVGLAELYAGRVKFGKVNVDQNPSVRGRFGVRGIPHLQLMRGDVRVGVLSARTRTRLMVELDALLA
jgi:thioredoxin 1